MAQSKRVSHLGRKNGPKTRFSARPWKNELGNGNAVHQEDKMRIEKIGGSRVDTEPTAWGLDALVWNLLWTGEEAMKKGMPISKKSGFESVEDLPRTAVGFNSKAYKDPSLPSQLRLPTSLNGEQRVRVLVRNARARTPPHHPISYAGEPNLVDWNGFELSSTA